MDRVSRLTTLQVVILRNRMFDRMDIAMRRSCAGGLSFGWDVPTANVYFPRLVRAWRRYREEYRKRQAAGAAYVCESHREYERVKPLAAFNVVGSVRKVANQFATSHYFPDGSALLIYRDFSKACRLPDRRIVAWSK